jgi:hypothetical protein
MGSAMSTQAPAKTTDSAAARSVLVTDALSEFVGAYCVAEHSSWVQLAELWSAFGTFHCIREVPLLVTFDDFYSHFQKHNKLVGVAPCFVVNNMSLVKWPERADWAHEVDMLNVTQESNNCTLTSG